MRVDTSKDGKLNLNVRKEPSISSKKVASIEHDTVIEVPEEYDIDEIKIFINVNGHIFKEYSKIREVCFLATHGILHLLGYDHMNEEDEKEMFKLQEELLLGFDIKR